MARQVRHKEGISVTVECVHCGRPIELVSEDDGVEIPDRVEFLRLHRDCLTKQEGAPASTGGSPERTRPVPGA